ncbi:hypothetical protein [Acidisphaera sp. L21]|uniref:hypothetical protein n=1 Tax=Acidisphaera sp. L21 TaxID=1641851 RepID=UPI00131D08DC
MIPAVENEAAGRVPRELILQRFVVDRPVDRRALYWRDEVNPHTAARVQQQLDGSLLVPCQTTLSFDTYFNSLFERSWRQHTTAGILKL